MTNLEDIEFALTKLNESIDDLNVDSIKHGIYDVRKSAELMKKLALLNDDAKKVKTAIGTLYDWSRINLVPDTFDSLGVDSATVDGIGRVSLSDDVSVTMPNKIDGYEWLRENGHASIISETVNASTLKALVRSMIRKGQTIPDCFNVKQFTRATITKVSK